MTEFNFKELMKNDERAKNPATDCELNKVQNRRTNFLLARTCFVREYCIRLRCVSLSYIFL